MTPSDPGAADPPVWVRTLNAVTGPRTLNELQRCLDALWCAHPEIADDVRVDCSVSAFEICSNILEHSAHGRPVNLRMDLRLTSDRIDMDFTDDGDPADVDLDGVSFPDDLADRGRGLPLAVSLLDELSYRREAGHNRWVLSHRVLP